MSERCPQLHDSGCRIVEQLAGVPWQPPPLACRDCRDAATPQAINLVTIGLAVTARRRRGLPADPALTRRLHETRAGPGRELQRLLAWFARPSDSCQCETRAAVMDEWGAAGCRQNLDTIVDWLMEEAQQRKLPHGRFTRAIARSLVRTAIRRFEIQSRDRRPLLSDQP